MDHLHTEARRLRSVADEARDRYDALNDRREAALDRCHPGGPSPALLAAALNEWMRAQVLADAAEKLAQGPAA
jgi:Xaa-Pro aminopeptidase